MLRRKQVLASARVSYVAACVVSAAVVLPAGSVLGQGQTYEKSYDYTKTMHFDITDENGNRFGGPRSGRLGVFSHCFAQDKHGDPVVDSDAGDLLDPEIRDIWTHLVAGGRENNDQPTGPVNMRPRQAWYDTGTLRRDEVTQLYDWERAFTSGGGHARSGTRNHIDATYRQDDRQRHKVDLAVTIQGGVTVNDNLDNPETAAAQSIAFSYASLTGKLERAEWVGPDGKVVPVQISKPNFRLGLRTVAQDTSNTTGDISVVKDPVTLSFFDDANMASLGSSVIYQNEFRTSGRASIEWRPDQDFVLMAGMDGMASATISTPSTWVLNPFNGSASITNGIFAAEGMFAGLPWSVVLDQGIVTARLASSAIPHDFNFICNAADAGNPVGNVIRQLESDMIGGVKDLKTVPSPGAIVVVLGSTWLVTRRRRG